MFVVYCHVSNNRKNIALQMAVKRTIVDCCVIKMFYIMYDNFCNKRIFLLQKNDDILAQKI
jgi:hypothetical protein